MVEVLTCSGPQTVNYKGLLNCKDLHALICSWLEEHSYTVTEVINQEQVLQNGKQIFIQLEPEKSVSDYGKIEMEIAISMSGLEKKTITHDGIKKHMDHGDVSVTIETFLITDYEGRWQNKPFYYFTKKIMERFFYKEYVEMYKEEVNRDKQLLMKEIKSFLNLYRFN